MKMLEGLFTIENITPTDEGLSARLRLNPSHPVFEGHFPQRPVLPGVCQMYALREVLCRFHGRDIRWESVREIKFLSPILPPDDTELTLSVRESVAEGDKMKIEAVLATQTARKTKIRAIFV